MDHEPEPVTGGEHGRKATPPPAPRKPYRRPQLADLGPVERLTRDECQRGSECIM
jgi:hypothetical protein